MALLQLLLFLLLCALALGWLSRRVNLPYPIALVIGGSLLGFVPGLPQVEFDPAFLLVLVLPPILYQAALLTSWRDFKANLRPIGFLAIGLVIVTTLAVGAVLKLLVPEIPWAVAFVFGAIVSPPDAVAATAVLSRYNIPHRVVVVLEGESLVNDASGLVLYKFAVAAVLTGVFSLAEASVQFVLVSAGGIAVGMLIAWVFVQLHRHIGDPFIEVLVSLMIPYGAYIAAESVHLSGVLAVVAAGLFRGRHAPKIVSAEMRILARSVWNILVFMLNSLIFILIGIELRVIVGRLDGFTPGELAWYALAVSAAAILVRFLWVYPAAFASRAATGAPLPPRGQLFLVSWCGMRGIVSLAAALALPLETLAGEPFPVPRPRDLPHLRRDPGHAGGAGPHARAADPAPGAGLGGGTARRAVARTRRHGARGADGDRRPRPGKGRGCCGRRARARRIRREDRARDARRAGGARGRGAGARGCASPRSSPSAPN